MKSLEFRHQGWRASLLKPEGAVIASLVAKLGREKERVARDLSGAMRIQGVGMPTPNALRRRGLERHDDLSDAQPDRLVLRNAEYAVQHAPATQR